jgi:hypothetical protein
MSEPICFQGALGNRGLTSQTGLPLQPDLLVSAGGLAREARLLGAVAGSRLAQRHQGI